MSRLPTALPLILLAAVSACRPAPQRPPPAALSPVATAPVTALPPVEPPKPGSPGGLPDDRTPISEAPFDARSAQGAANVVQTYYALLAERRYPQARALWSDGRRASGQPDAQAFAAGFARYASYNAQVGAPGETEGGAGSIYVSVPVVVYGRLTSGAEVHEKGEAQLRRVNDVPGSTLAQRAWHIFRIDTTPTG
jgi:hypothetical protein